MRRLLRGLFILWTLLRHGLDELVLSSFERPGLRLLTRIVSVGRDLSRPRGERLDRDRRGALDHRAIERFPADTVCIIMR